MITYYQALATIAVLSLLMLTYRVRLLVQGIAILATCYLAWFRASGDAGLRDAGAAIEKSLGIVDEVDKVAK
jgi:hypothetical protein